MRDFIDIVEATMRFRLPADLYHASKVHLDIGTVLEPRGNFTVEPEIEALLESTRPADQLPRQKVVYMMADPMLNRFFGIGGASEIYRVRPVGKVHRHDASIIGLMQKALRQHNQPDLYNAHYADAPPWDQTETMTTLAEKYWTGVGNPYRKRTYWLFEYTATGAIVDKQVWGTQP